ncbi:MAG: hypothetical protein AB8H47_23360 [Bacteroidia bacterium]
MLRYACFLLLVLGSFTASLSQNASAPPLYFTMGDEYERAAHRRTLLSWPGVDSTTQHELELWTDTAGKPLLYYANINTPVCIDGSCKPLYIEIYWDLLGNYIGYGVIAAELLTKYDHELFESADYQKLHRLLLNKHSILARKKLSDLFDASPQTSEKVTFNGVELDAVSGATKREIGQSVVKGALYSCYTLWHLVYGAVSDSMEQSLAAMYDSRLSRDFLHSDYPDYQYHALKQMDNLMLEQELNRVLEIFPTASPLVRTYLIKKFPNEWFQRAELAFPLYRSFATIDRQSQTLLLQHLAFAPLEVTEILAISISSMTRNQLKLYLKQVSANPLNETVEEEMQKVIASKSYANSYLLEDFLAEN